MQYRMIIKNAGSPLQEADLKAFEAEFDIALPSEYREFLLLYNGGDPKPDTFNYQGRLGINASDLRHFRSIDELAIPVQNIRDGKIIPSMPQNFIPIGHDSGGNAICISTSSHDLGEIYFWEHDVGEIDHIHLVANSFNEFVANLVDYPAMVVPAKRNFWNSILRLLRCKRS